MRGSSSSRYRDVKIDDILEAVGKDTSQFADQYRALFSRYTYVVLEVDPHAWLAAHSNRVLACQAYRNCMIHC